MYMFNVATILSGLIWCAIFLGIYVICVICASWGLSHGKIWLAITITFGIFIGFVGFSVGFGKASLEQYQGVLAEETQRVCDVKVKNISRIGRNAYKLTVVEKDGAIKTVDLYDTSDEIILSENGSVIKKAKKDDRYVWTPL